MSVMLCSGVSSVWWISNGASGMISKYISKYCVVD